MIVFFNTLAKLLDQFCLTYFLNNHIKKKKFQHTGTIKLRKKLSKATIISEIITKIVFLSPYGANGVLCNAVDKRSKI